MTAAELTHEVVLSGEQRQQALCMAADVLESKRPRAQAYFRAWMQPNWIDCYASWRWPGVVRVTLRYTGQLVAESMPGAPRVLSGGQAMSASFNAARARLAQTTSSTDGGRTGARDASQPRTLGARLRFTRADGLAMAQGVYASSVEARNKADALLEQIEDEMVQTLEDSEEDAPVSPYLARLRQAIDLLLHEAEQTSSAIEILDAIARSDTR